MEENISKIYVKTDISGNITAINSFDFISDVTDWTLIDEGTGDKYHHAQNNYLDKPLTDENGIYNYKLAKIAEGSATVVEYSEEIRKRREWRARINELELI